jgi:hypothetical protein
VQRIEKGMTYEEVVQIMGCKATSKFGMENDKGNVSMAYTWDDGPYVAGIPTVQLDVHIYNGKVWRKERTEMKF